MSDLGKLIADRMKSKAAPSGDGAENDDEEESSADEGEGSYDSVESDAADELASLCGVAEGDVAAFKTALKQYVKACTSKTETAPAAEEDEE
jgi:hypothetical protein